eukprot:CAMPEP_0182835800 /NCGR_PEP_ID=MMETSP0006_2-20121128/21718_1 /TAXON_ID=97485 /ORGANISM="Prymnesium parvum, Strain Texoma1" /LENGTH=463 /DNA_ID=CAMNT_0024964291 /DNA_START=57 /DNA_END=1448 /DNA_ORIENTATION=+
MSSEQEHLNSELAQAASTSTQPRKLGKTPMSHTDEHKHKDSRTDSTDEQMEDNMTEQTSGKLSDLYMSDDMAALQVDKHMAIQRKLMAQDPNNREYMKHITNDLKKHQQETLTRIFLSNTKNTHAFSSEDILAAVISEVDSILEIEIAKQDIIITALSRTGPYVVALRGDCAHTLVCEGSIELVDESTDPPVVQMFSIKEYSTEPKKKKTTEEAESMEVTPEPSKMDFSIYFNLPAEYTGGRDEKGELNLPKQLIDKALIDVFSNPDISYRLIQPKTELGFYRNAFRAIITMPRMEKLPADMNVLSKLKFVALTPGARPATASMSQDVRKYFGISNCCFRSTCKEEQGCDFRAKRLNEMGYQPKGRNSMSNKERKRLREEEQTEKREQKLRSIRALKAARRQEAMCKMYLEGKCDKDRMTCQKGAHGSMIFSRTIVCASAKENSDWVCRLGDKCPYSCHINPE